MMFWEKKFYQFIVLFVLGILSILLFPQISFFRYSLVFLPVIILSVLTVIFSIIKWGYVKRAFLFLSFIILPVTMGLFLTSQRLQIGEKHIINVIKSEAKTITLRGYIHKEPEYFQDRVRVYVNPDQVMKDGKWHDVKTGNIMITYSFSEKNFPEIFSYGNYIEISGDFKRPSEETNPGGFNYRAFLENSGIYYTAHISDIKSVTIAGPVKKNLFIDFSLNVKRKFLQTIRRTVPFPESAFLGGIILGLRYGLDGVYLEGSDFQIKDDFKRSGVNHVLAVSGLHVTILSIFFIGLFSLFGIPKRIYSVVIILLLLIFLVITGGRPSTLRAVIMHSLILLTWAISKRGLKASIELGIAVAAFTILLFNPLLLKEAAFVLSFGAVLSLVLITPHLDVFFKKYFIGYSFWAFIIIFAVFTASLVIFKEHFFLPLNLWIFFLVSISFFILSVKYEEKKQLASPSFRRIPSFITSFISAQFAIQIGMMIPLSAYFFGRYPIAGMYANYIAIPLIGLNVQIGVMAVIVSLIPIAGIYIALLLNAGNFILLRLFLLMAQFFSENFPYPFIRKISFIELALYFVVLFSILNLHHLKMKYLDYKYKLKLFLQKNDKRYTFYRTFPYIILITVITVISLSFVMKEKNELDITFFSLSRGNVVFIKTPTNNILINSGRSTKRGTREWDEADRVIMNTLMYYGINRIDKMIITDYSADNNSAITTIINEYPVKTIYIPTNIENIRDKSYDEFLYSTEDRYIHRNREAFWVKDRYTTVNNMLEILKNKNIGSIVVKAGDIIHKEKIKVGNKTGFVEVFLLYPEIKEFEDHFKDNMVVKIEYSFQDEKKSFLIFGEMHNDRSRDIKRYSEFYENTDVLLVPLRFLNLYDLKDIVEKISPVDILFHIDFFRSADQWDKLEKEYGFLKRAGTNMYDITSGYVRYKIKNGKLLRDTKQYESISDEIFDIKHEF